MSAGLACQAVRLVIDVTNVGPRIPDDLAPALFEPFRRLDERSGSAEGLGLGLSIVRSVAIAHNGYVSARPRSAGGLEISVLLPAAVS